MERAGQTSLIHKAPNIQPTAPEEGSSADILMSDANQLIIGHANWDNLNVFGENRSLRNQKNEAGIDHGP